MIAQTVFFVFLIDVDVALLLILPSASNNIFSSREQKKLDFSFGCAVTPLILSH